MHECFVSMLWCSLVACTDPRVMYQNGHTNGAHASGYQAKAPDVEKPLYVSSKVRKQL
jgi:hypothetical protein